MGLKIVSIVGARPQFIKAAPLTRVLREKMKEIFVHTGQHYDDNMSRIFFTELGLTEPDYNLGVGSGTHGYQTGAMLERIEEVLIKEKPNFVLVYGDTNSTLAGALAAVKLHIPIGHIEAGLRSFNRTMPEEINRVLTDRCASMLFCPTETAVKNLRKEGITQGVYLTGDVMYDAALQFGKIAEKRSTILSDLGVIPKTYLLCTVHRVNSTDFYDNLKGIVQALIETEEAVLFSLHPRTKKFLKTYGLIELLKNSSNVRLIDPVSYLDMIQLEKHAKKILTDSGGVQKEAYFYKVPCITLREETEWIETVKEGWNILVGTDSKKILQAIETFLPSSNQSTLFGDGHASEKIVDLVYDYVRSVSEKDQQWKNSSPQSH